MIIRNEVLLKTKCRDPFDNMRGNLLAFFIPARRAGSTISIGGVSTFANIYHGYLGMYQGGIPPQEKRNGHRHGHDRDSKRTCGNEGQGGNRVELLIKLELRCQFVFNP